jgi:hypothetical protein
MLSTGHTDESVAFRCGYLNRRRVKEDKTPHGSNYFLALPPHIPSKPPVIIWYT